MPIPDPPEASPSPIGAIVALFRQLHSQLRSELEGMGVAELNWAPAEGANSTAVVVTHLLGSEAESVGILAGQDVSRDRDAEFRPGRASLATLMDLIDAADASLATLASSPSERLDEWLSLPTLAPEEVRPGLTWLLGNYGHAREHLGEIQLTRQLYRSRGRQPRVSLHIEGVLIDCLDLDRQCAFWIQALDFEMIGQGPSGGYLLAAKNRVGPTLGLMPSTEAKVGKNRVHLDLRPADQELEVRRLEAIGARSVDIGQVGRTWVVMADPESNEFCVLRGSSGAGASNPEDVAG